MKSPSEQTWRVRLVEGLDALAAWAQDKGAWRWVGSGLGVICVVLWWYRLWAVSGDGRAGTIAHGLISFGFLVAGGLLISPMLVPLVARPFLRFIDSIYLGGSAIERPPLTYLVAERRMQEGRHEDAAAEFERLAYWHPRESRPYVDGIRAARLAGDDKSAHRLFRRGLLRCPTSLDQLRASLQTPRALARQRPAWQTQSGA